ncbi:MAG: hypothetical protein AAF787_12520, partial [Chloroflexota bacterium]
SRSNRNMNRRHVMTVDTSFPIARIEISDDGREILSTSLDSRYRVHRGFFGRIIALGPIAIHYGPGGCVRAIGTASVNYRFWDGRIGSVGHDARVQIMVSERPPIRYDDDRR